MRRLLALLAVGVVGCKKAPPPLFSDAEIAANRAALERNIADKPSCARPVLHAPPAEIETVDLAKRFKLPDECDDLQKALDAEAAKGPMAELPFQVLEAPHAAECMEHVAKIVRSAVSTDAVCASPYDEPEAGAQFKPQFIAYIIALRARELAKTSPAEGLALALDGVRFFQDGARGGTLMQAMLSVVAKRLVLDRAALPIAQARDNVSNVDVALLKQTSFGDPTVVEAAIHDVETLLASEPSFHDVLVAEANWIGAERGLKHLTGKERDEGAAALAASIADHAAWGMACPAGASVSSCRIALERPSAAPQVSANETLNRAGGLPPYLARWGEPLVRLSVLRFALEVKAQGCPPAITSPPWSEYLAPVVLGDSLRADKSASGFTLRPPPWMNRPTDEWLIACPAPAK